jgi:maltose-binding protein MalE
MNTIEDIVKWIKDYDNSDDNIEKFTAELIQMIMDMNYTASNGGAAVGYAGLIGYSEDVKSAIFLTVENLTGNSNGNENKF